MIVLQEKRGGDSLSLFDVGGRAVPWRFNFIGIYDERKY